MSGSLKLFYQNVRYGATISIVFFGAIRFCYILSSLFVHTIRNWRQKSHNFNIKNICWCIKCNKSTLTKMERYTWC